MLTGALDMGGSIPMMRRGAIIFCKRLGSSYRPDFFRTSNAKHIELGIGAENRQVVLDSPCRNHAIPKNARRASLQIPCECAIILIGFR